MDQSDGVVGILDSFTRKLEELSRTAAGRLSLVDNKCCVTMLGLLLQDTSTVAHKALDALFNLAQDAAVIYKLHESIVPLLVALFHCADNRELATHVLVNLVLHGPPRMATAAAVAIPTLVTLLEIPDVIGANALDIFAKLAREHADAIVQADALAPLVDFLDLQDLSGLPGDCAAESCNVLELLSEGSNARVDAIVAAGALTHATKLLASESMTMLSSAARLIGKLSAGTRRAVAASAAIVPLVALCKRGRMACNAACDAAYALGVLAEHSASACVAIQEAGGIAALVALDDECSEWALCNIAKNSGASEVLDALVARRATVTVMLKRLLQPAASELVAIALFDSNRAALRRALDRGEFVKLQTQSMADARKLLETLDNAYREQLEQCGLNADPPAEFVCSITYEVMTDPVVASDGHSYEREAIYAVIHSGNGKSPLTRAPLTTTLVPNHALRQRIEAHESEQDAQAEKIIAQHSKLTVELAASKKEAAALRSQLAHLCDRCDVPVARKRLRRGEGSSSAEVSSEAAEASAEPYVQIVIL